MLNDRLVSLSKHLDNLRAQSSINQQQAPGTEEISSVPGA